MSDSEPDASSSNAVGSATTAAKRRSRRYANTKIPKGLRALLNDLTSEVRTRTLARK